MSKACSKRHMRRLAQMQTETDLQILSISQKTKIFKSQCVEASHSSTSLTRNISSSHNSSHPNFLMPNMTQLHSDSEDSNVNSDNYHSSFNHTSDDSLENDNTNFNNTTEGQLPENEFQKSISSWAIQFNISLVALSALLCILKKFLHMELPTDARTLLKTPRSVKIDEIEGGQYSHFGFSNALEQICTETDIQRDTIELMVNIDGLPLSKSSSGALWPVLCSTSLCKKVFMIGAFFGYMKPQNSDQFLEKFVSDLSQLIRDGFENKGRRFKVRLKALICDAPAKAFVLKIKGHTGYHSCTKCTIEGEFLGGRCCFPLKENQHKLRKDFRNNLYEDYQIGRTILTQIPHFDLVSNVPLDYMHLVCLGVMKKLITLWLEGPLCNRWSSQVINEVNKRLLALKFTIPIDFVRKPRPIKYYKIWKATEFRQILLYTGPIVLCNILRTDVYLNFVALHIAVSIMTNPNYSKCEENISYCESLLIYFVKTFQILYGEEYVSHNVHNLIHLPNDVRQHGPLDCFSAFKYENHMSLIKRKLRKNDKPLQQLIKRYAEENVLGNVDFKNKASRPNLERPHCDGPMPDSFPFEYQYKQLNLTDLLINCNKKDNTCILQNGKFVDVYNILSLQDVVYVYGTLLTKIGSLYTEPCESVNINIHVVKETTEFHLWKAEEIKSKAWKMPYKDNFVVVPILHS